MKALDFHAIEKYQLPIELMMENAGFHLARVIASQAKKEDNIIIGIGQGNNGGGGLVAARRLLNWGYKVTLNVPHLFLNDLGQKQFERAKAVGALLDIQAAVEPDIFVDAWFGLNQRLPLPRAFLDKILYFNQHPCTKISLDIPTGLVAENEGYPHIHADIVCTLAAPKKILFSPQLTAQIFVADLGIPRQAYLDLGLYFDLPFQQSGLVQLLM